MLEKMVRMKNRKGFTLIEMVVVVAIVAILVAILVPVIGNSITKSHAATNAANLRAVEARLATLKVSNPESFVPTSQVEPGDTIGDLLDYFRPGSSTAFLDTIEASGGKLVFSESVSLEGVPTAVKVQADTGMDVSKGQEMIIYLIDDQIVAAYKGNNGYAFTKDDFAEVAETGEFNGTGLQTAEGIVGEWACSKGVHTYSPDKNNPGKHICKYCGNASGDCVDYAGSITGADGTCDICGHSCLHKYENGVCKYCGETDGTHSCSDNRGNWGQPDGVCDTTGCGKTCATKGSTIAHNWKDGACTYGHGCECPNAAAHETLTDDCPTCGLASNHTHTWVANTLGTKHKCDDSNCNGEHDIKWTNNGNAATHKCSGCDNTANHSWSSVYKGGVVCTVCQYVKQHSFVDRTGTGFMGLSADGKCDYCDQASTDSKHTTS